MFAFCFMHSQTVTVNTSNSGCKNSGTITAATSGILSPSFQLQMSDGTIVLPVAGNSSAFTNSNVFNALSNGTYKVVAQDFSSNLFFSSNIVVTDGYTNMTLTASNVSLPCLGATKALPVSVTGGKAPFIYVITDDSTGTQKETSSPTSAGVYTFAPLPLGNYTVSVTDACGVVNVASASVNSPLLTINDVKTAGNNYYQNTPNNCNFPIKILIQGGFVNINGSQIAASEKNLFTWKIRYKGNLYGTDVNQDGFSDLNSSGYPLSNTFVAMPLGVTREDIINNISTTKIVVFDQCGNTKEFSSSYLRGTLIGKTDCINGSRVQSTINTGLLCLPINFTFTNTSNPSDVLQITQTSDTQFLTGFTPGATYSFTYSDGNGVTNSNGFQNTTVTIPTNNTLLTFVNESQENRNALLYGTIKITPSAFNADGTFQYYVSSSDNALVPIGTSGTGTNGNVLPNVNATDPSGYWPMGTYTIRISTSCGTVLDPFTVKGYRASLSGNTITPVCGGFNYVMKGIFDVISDYEVVIIAGPSNVGLTQNLISNTASTVFSNLSYGTYTAGLRIKGGTTFILTQNFSFGSTGGDAITVDKDSTGGYVCTSGGNDGRLTIMASSISPAPSNVLQYRLSTDGGLTYGSWQNSNVFSGLTNKTYTFQVKDGCGFIVTDNAQVGAISSPQATTSIGTICELDTTTSLQLNVDINNATYTWVGNGIDANNQHQKSPFLNINNLQIGVNNYTVTVSSTFCGNSSVASVDINKISSTKAKALTGLATDSKFGISTQASTKWLATTKNGALVLESSNKGFVITRMKKSEFPTGSNAVKGMLAYDTDDNCLKMFNGDDWTCIARICP